MTTNKQILDAIHAIPSDKELLVRDLYAVIAKHENAGVHPIVVWTALKLIKQTYELGMPDLLGDGNDKT